MGLKIVVLGFAPITHKELAAAFDKTHAPVSAGFCEPMDDGSKRWRAFGESTSLGLRAAPGDGPLIEIFQRACAKTAPTSPVPA